MSRKRAIDDLPGLAAAQNVQKRHAPPPHAAATTVRKPALVVPQLGALHHDFVGAKRWISDLCALRIDAPAKRQRTTSLDAPRRIVDVPDNTAALTIDSHYIRGSPELPIVNTVATVTFDNKSIDAALFSQRLPGVAHNPSRFAAAKMRSQRAMMLAFGGGRAVCPGANSVENSQLAVLEFIEMLLCSGYVVSYRDFTVVNIVCSTEAGFRVDISAIAAHYPMCTEYKPDKFPGLTFRMRKPEIVFNVFVSGAIICTGSKCHEDSKRAWAWFYRHILCNFRQKASDPRVKMNSAAYWLDTLARTDTFAEDTDGVWRRCIGASDAAISPDAHDLWLMRALRA